MIEKIFLIAITFVWVIGVIMLVFIIGGDEE